MKVTMLFLGKTLEKVKNLGHSSPFTCTKSDSQCCFKLQILVLYMARRYQNCMKIESLMAEFKFGVVNTTTLKLE
jgi:hypothetical protein